MQPTEVQPGTLAPYPPPPTAAPPGGILTTPPAAGYAAPQLTNTLAVVSLVCGIASLPLMLACFTGAMPALAAVICGHLGMAEAKQLGGFKRSWALAGLILGYCAFAFIPLLILLNAILGAADYATGGSR